MRGERLVSSFAKKQELQNRTVDDFWQPLGLGYRSLFEPKLLFQGESFGALARLAEDPENSRAP